MSISSPCVFVATSRCISTAPIMCACVRDGGHLTCGTVAELPALRTLQAGGGSRGPPWAQTRCLKIYFLLSRNGCLIFKNSFYLSGITAQIFCRCTIYYVDRTMTISPGGRGPRATQVVFCVGRTQGRQSPLEALRSPLPLSLPLPSSPFPSLSLQYPPYP